MKISISLGAGFLYTIERGSPTKSRTVRKPETDSGTDSGIGSGTGSGMGSGIGFAMGSGRTLG